MRVTTAFYRNCHEDLFLYGKIAGLVNPERKRNKDEFGEVTEAWRINSIRILMGCKPINFLVNRNFLIKGRKQYKPSWRVFWSCHKQSMKNQTWKSLMVRNEMGFGVGSKQNTNQGVSMSERNSNSCPLEKEGGSEQPYENTRKNGLFNFLRRLHTHSHNHSCTHSQAHSHALADAAVTATTKKTANKIKTTFFILLNFWSLIYIISIIMLDSIQFHLRWFFNSLFMGKYT